MTPHELRDRFLREERFLPAEKKKKLYAVALIFSMLGLVGFVILLRGVLLGDVSGLIDAPIQAWVQDARSDALTVIMIALAVAFGPIALPLLILAIVIMWTIRRRHFWRPLLLAAGTLTGVGLALTITHAVGRERPPVDQMLFGEDLTFSFPSGHVLGACNFLFLVTYLVFSRRQGSRAAAAALVVVVFLVVGTAFSRIYLGYHWASDAMASIALALVILGGVIAIDTHHTVRVRCLPPKI